MLPIIPPGEEGYERPVVVFPTSELLCLFGLFKWVYLKNTQVCNRLNLISHEGFNTCTFDSFLNDDLIFIFCFDETTDKIGTRINCAVSLVACSFKNRGEKAATSLSHFSNINDSNIAFRALLPLHVQTLFHHSSPSGRCVSISAVISQRNANCILLACVWKPLWVPWRISDTK